MKVLDAAGVTSFERIASYSIGRVYPGSNIVMAYHTGVVRDLNSPLAPKECEE
jgi:hypothetical protein